MKLYSTLAAFGMLQAVLAQALAPSPTESIGCTPHDDHWHCEGPRPTEDAVAPTPDAPAPDTPAPETTTSAAAPPADDGHGEDDHDHDDDDHSDSGEGTVDPGPSPTASIGCEPHGDHWHCEGPRPTDGASGTEDEDPAEADASSAPSDPAEAGAAGVMVGVPVVALALLAQAAF